MCLRKLYDRISEKKIVAKRYFDESSKQLDLPEISASLDGFKLEAELSSKLGQYKSSSKITVPDIVSEAVIRQDQIQYALANSINGLHGEQRREKLVEYINALIKILEINVTGVTSNLPGSLPLISNNPSSVKASTNHSSLKKFLDERNFKSTLLPDDLTKDQGYLIWPVTLLSNTTYIHKAQAQLIKPLVNSGWKLLVIIGDCGKKSTWKESFSEEIKKILTSLDIKIEASTVAYLSDYYKQSESTRAKLVPEVTGDLILSTFHEVSENLIWKEFDLLIKKNYDDLKQQEIEKRSVLNNIQPLLFWALVASIVSVNSSKILLIAGEDEEDQWNHITYNHTRNKLGIIYIHELKKEGGKTMDQVDLRMSNIQEMKDKLGVGNTAKWLYTHFVELPKFSTNVKPSFCKITDMECQTYHNNCLDCLFEKGNNYSSSHFDKQEFVNTIWPLANPAN